MTKLNSDGEFNRLESPSYKLSKTVNVALTRLDLVQLIDYLATSNLNLGGIRYVFIESLESCTIQDLIHVKSSNNTRKVQLYSELLKRLRTISI